MRYLKHSLSTIHTLFSSLDSRVLIIWFYLASCQPVMAESNGIMLLSTTSVENSGLLGHLIPRFTERHGIQVHVVARGTGMALRAAERGDADFLMVHHVESEKAFVKAGFGHTRRPFMYNNFVIVGPKQDPANISDEKSILDVLERLYNSQVIFVSRADDSGTHKRERSLWQLLDLEPKGGAMAYREAGSGMGTTLNLVAAQSGYTLTDRGTWLSFNNRQDMEILFAGDPLLFNQYSVIEINAGRHPHVKSEAAKIFSDWLIGEEGQALIDTFRINGEQLFTPNYKAVLSSQ